MQGLEFEVIGRSWPYLLKGLQYTVQLTVVAAIGGTIFGTLLAMARLSSFKPLATAAAGYVNLMRSIPLLLVIFWFYFLVPVLVQAVTGAERPPQIGAERSAYITFIMFEAAYFCEIMRAGIQSIPKGQVGAAGKIAQRDSRIVEMYLFVAVVYFVLCSLLSMLVRRLQTRIAIVR